MKKLNLVACNRESSTVWFNPGYFNIYALLGDQGGRHLVWDVCSFEISGV